MIKIILYSILFGIIYAVLGIYLEKYNIITNTEHYVYYGFICGFIWSIVYDILLNKD